MDKLLTFPGRTDKGIFTYVIDAERGYLEKTASEYHPTIAAYINAAKPIPGMTQILLTALGAGEWWGDNVNGDYFPQEALAYEGEDYGYKTFKTLAKIYKHHVNKDPFRSYGDVALAVYNPTFHRVELIVLLDNAKAPDIEARMNSGDYPDWSMGCKVPYDICNVCGNRAPTRAHYCEHAKYYLGKIDPISNKKVYVINTRPKFFDISIVLIGADRIAKTLKKVASPYGNIPILSSAYVAEKEAELKRAEIEKEVPPNQPPASADTINKATELAKTITEVKAMEPPMSRDLLNDLAKQSLPRSMSTMTIMGILPKPQEFQRIILIRMGHRNLADQLDEKNVCFDPMSVQEPTDEHRKMLDLGAHNFDDDIMAKLTPLMADRSYAAPHLGRRIVIMIKQGREYPLPQFVKVSATHAEANGERKPIGPLLPLLAAAGAYAVLTQSAPQEALKGVNKILSSKAGLVAALGLGLGLIHGFNRVAGPKQTGQFSPLGASSDPDTSDVFSRIEALKQKPFAKVALDYNLGSAAKRLFLGVPAAYMASGVLQKHRELRPYDDEGRIKGFIRRNPDVISAALIADAMLSAKGSPFSTRSLFHHAKGLGGKAVGPVKAKAMGVAEDLGKFGSSVSQANELCGEELIKTADAQEYLSNALIWPLAMGKANLPGRIVGGLFDQAALEAGSRLIKRHKEKKQKELSSGKSKQP